MARRSPLPADGVAGAASPGGEPDEEAQVVEEAGVGERVDPDVGEDASDQGKGCDEAMQQGHQEAGRIAGQEPGQRWLRRASQHEQREQENEQE